MAQRILHRRKQVGIAGRLCVDQPFRSQPRLRQGGREQVASANDPQDRPGIAGGDPGEKQCRGRIFAPVRPCGGHLVQPTQSQPAIGKARIDRCQAERQ